ncbi:hypothetical protein GGX14DRAFT_385572 [Mycena pura]|uniref:Uncharacterized protein n=1 Tax=Mycena pura TaxID=153505 RepID=A0AAD6YQW9_9AGAR|nr:hypothetical protein GGX14DRAFT_385572 [Mycena pura]
MPVARVQHLFDHIPHHQTQSPPSYDPEADCITSTWRTPEYLTDVFLDRECEDRPATIYYSATGEKKELVRSACTSRGIEADFQLPHDLDVKSDKHREKATTVAQRAIPLTAPSLLPPRVALMVDVGGQKCSWMMDQDRALLNGKVFTEATNACIGADDRRNLSLTPFLCISPVETILRNPQCGQRDHQVLKPVEFFEGNALVDQTHAFKLLVTNQRRVEGQNKDAPTSSKPARAQVGGTYCPIHHVLASPPMSTAPAVVISAHTVELGGLEVGAPTCRAGRSIPKMTPGEPVHTKHCI